MNSKATSWILLLVLSCIWGSSFILMKLGMETSDGKPVFNDTQVAALRMTIAAIVLLPFAIRAIQKMNSWRNFISLAIVGFAGNFFPAFLFTYSETGISSGYAGMLNSFTPIFALIIGFAVFKNRLTRIQVTGVIIGTTGIILLTLAGQSLSMSGNWTHIAAVIAATLCYAISLNTIKYTLQHLKSIEITALAFVTTLLPGLIISLTSGTFDTIEHNPHAYQSLGFIMILSVIGTALAVILFNYLIAASSVLFASSVTYLIPVVAILIGLGFNEKINPGQIISMLIILSGVFIANVLPNRLKRIKSKHNTDTTTV